MEIDRRALGCFDRKLRFSCSGMKDKRYDRDVVGCGRVGEVRRASTSGPKFDGPAFPETGGVGAIGMRFWATFETGDV